MTVSLQLGGGGGVILPEEIKELMAYGITKIYSPDDGRAMGLQGMINDLVEKADYPTGHTVDSRPLTVDTEKLRSDKKTYLDIKSRDGWVSILELQPEGKKRMTLSEFFRGNKL